MRSYFFIPGDKYKNISLIRQQRLDEIIIDLEDAVRGSDRAGIIAELKEDPESRELWIRVPLRTSFEQPLNVDICLQLLNEGFTKFVLPKLRSEVELKELLAAGGDVMDGIQYILLIEHPQLLLELDGLALSTPLGLKGIGLGSHDMMSLVGGKHVLKNLQYPRQKVLYAAKAAGLEAIDIASMELRDQLQFEEELKDGFDKGYDAKFLIHPWQLNLFNRFEYYSEEEIAWARQVVEAYSRVKGNEEFAPVIIGNEVIERPHLKRALMIIEKTKSYGSK